MRREIIEDIIGKVENTAEKEGATRDEMMLVVATFMKTMMEDADCNLMEIEINDKKLVIGLRQITSETKKNTPVH